MMRSGRSTDGIVGIRRVAGWDWGRAAVGVATVATVAVSVDGMGPSVLGRRPVVASGMGRLRRGDVVDLAGSVAPQRLAASETARGVVVIRGVGGVDDGRGLGGEHGVGHAGGASVVRHAGSDTLARSPQLGTL
jgi:hypothetical protein